MDVLTILRWKRQDIYEVRRERGGEMLCEASLGNKPRIYGGLIAGPVLAKTQGNRNRQWTTQPHNFPPASSPMRCRGLPQLITRCRQWLLPRLWIHLPIHMILWWQSRYHFHFQGVWTRHTCLVQKDGDHIVISSLVLQGWNDIQFHLYLWWRGRQKITVTAL